MLVNNKLSRIIAVISLILLAAFLINWNYIQYQKEVELLIKNLDTQYKLAESDRRDSIILTAIKYADGFDVDLSFTDSAKFNSDTLVINKIFKALEIENVSTNLKLDSSIFSYNFTASIDSFNIQTPKSDPDNAVFPLFLERLENEGMNTEISIFHPKSTVERDREFIIDDYKGYILKQILPSVLMSTLLFLLVALGFFLLNKSRKEQESISLLKDEFVSNMTHELKTPISTISVALESLSNYGAINDPEKAIEYIDISKHELNRLHILVDKVLKMSRFEDKGMKLDKQTIDVRKLIEEIMVSMQLHFEKHQVEYDILITGESHFVYADRIHLTNVIYNVLDNAVKYSKETPLVSVRVKLDNNEVVLEVEDNGVGIEDEYKAKIFDRFFRVPQKDQHNTKGHGLGLNYVKEVMDKHAGKIELESEVNKGTCIRLIFPKSDMA